MKKVKKLLNSKKILSMRNTFHRQDFLESKFRKINRESIGTVLFDFKKYKKIIKLIGSSQKEPSLVIFSLKLI